jgi:hypothetical protein
MAVYKSSNNRPLSGITPAQRASGQIILSGSNPSIVCPNGIFYLELLQVSAGVTIADGDGVTMVAGITSFEQDQSPLRCDNGIAITGTVVTAKGFVVEGCL